ncbi:MAG: T9SS type A sorting domain-containing protein [Bacteroidota bacterium]|nr:T9SS type A sorting domain-containing protein [Bacteroidota bacterium]MDP4232739.1 T9SS type A sorting domain-containing protein [Bacteroidota bacterium]MDP4244055.1 T9SS type A sorting domain-containing protein [Bacteroidota bacterium]MDP4287585.1 T9SS type A sorting domain-containing protein [Bacteroidota bacterium]
MSFLTVKVQDLYYSNNPYGNLIGQSCASQPVNVILNNGQSSLVGDTLRTIWPETGFDIEQDAYPVEFTNSGVIVISIKIINHLASPVSAQAQYLLDNMNSNAKPGGGTDGANDNPYLIHRYGYTRNWQDCGPNPIPSFYLAFENPPDSAVLGTVGIGYVNDSFPPRPLGLKPLSFMEFGDWQNQGNFTWGPPCASSRTQFADEATLLMGPSGLTASAYSPGGSSGSDSITEIFRTAYGTPEWCFDHGKIVGFALYPQHIYWDPITRKYTPNPFQVETFLFNVESGTASGVKIRQTVGDPVVIKSPKPTGAPTTQQQNVGTIPGWNPNQSGGIADIRWIDSVLVLPSGCAASFPVNIQFDVTSPGLDPVFNTPWNDCSLTIECAHPDTIPPQFENSFTGCDSIKYDTITVHDNDYYDIGLDNITYSSPDMNPTSQYAVTPSTMPVFGCSKTPFKIFVHQVDTFQKGHVIFAFTDCAKNVSLDTICFTGHPPLPDLTAPRFFDSVAADCHARCRTLNVTDTVNSLTSIDRGVDVIDTVADTNMTLSGVPAGGKYPANTPLASIGICVTDSMQNGTIILRATDTAHNVRLDTISFCTTPDTHAAIITQHPYTPADSSWHLHVVDTQAWDRGIDSIWVDNASNVTTMPASWPAHLGCVRTFDFALKVNDTTKCASGTVHVRDCAGNITTPLLIAKSEGAKPGITSTKTVLCGGSDAIVLTATGNFATWLWSTGETTKTLTVNTAGSYTVSGNDGEGCTSTSDPIVITSSPAIPVITPPGPVAVCAPDSVLLDAGTPYATYQWLKDGSALTGATLEKLKVGATGAYTVQVTNAAGCSGTSPAVQITINPLPPQPVITFANNILSSTPALSYQWSLDGTVIPGATGQSYTPQTGGDYTVTITDANGCTNTSLPYSNSGSTVIALPSMVLAQQSQHVTIPLSIATSQSFPANVKTWTATIAYNPTMLVPDPNGPTFSSTTPGIVTYTGTSSATTGMLQDLQFIAALGDSICTPVTIQSFTWSAPGISVTMQNGNFCLTGLCTQGGTRLIDPNQTQFSLSAPRPNPAFTNVQIDYTLIEQGQTTLVIYDLLGHEVRRLIDGVQEPGTYSVSADISSLPAGTYVYSLRTPTIVESHHLQIAR